jgi:hypothetical protein
MRQLAGFADRNWHLRVLGSTCRNAHYEGWDVLIHHELLKVIQQEREREIERNVAHRDFEPRPVRSGLARLVRTLRGTRHPEAGHRPETVSQSISSW